MIDHSKFEGIILAAGLSTRMNDWKPKIEIGDVPILIRTIVPMVNICAKVNVVGGHNYSALVNLVESTTILSDEQKNKISLIENSEYINGMLSSVKCGLNNISSEREGIFITLGDIPFVLFSTYQKLLECFSEDDKAEVYSPVTLCEDEEIDKEPRILGGHPVLIKSTIKEHILQCADDEILKDVLQNFKHKFCTVADKGIGMDIDNFSDLQAAKSYMENLKNLH